MAPVVSSPPLHPLEPHQNGPTASKMKNRLRALRRGNEWSQAELARRLRVSRQTVNALERGKYHPSLPLAFRIAHLFETAIEDVFEAGAEFELETSGPFA